MSSAASALFRNSARSAAAALRGDLVLELQLTRCFSRPRLRRRRIELSTARVSGRGLLRLEAATAPAERAAERSRPEFDGVRGTNGRGSPTGPARSGACVWGRRNVLERPNDILAVDRQARGASLGMEPVAAAGGYTKRRARSGGIPARRCARGVLGGDWRVRSGGGAAVFREAPRYSSPRASGRAPRLRTLSDAEFTAGPTARGDLEPIPPGCREEADLEEVIAAAKSKRLTRARAERMDDVRCWA